jgi:putative nucleotidyltransferase with HDIG domain
MDTGFIKARKSQFNFYNKVPLYMKNSDRFILYKPAGINLKEMRLNEGRHPRELYIKRDDKIKGIQEAQRGLNQELEGHINSGNPVKVKETLVTLMEETLTEPRSGSLEGISNTVDLMVNDYSNHQDVLKSLIDMSYKDYSTILHSINVMAFAIGFASYMGYSQPETKALGLSALLHDAGKTKINTDILIAPRKLTREEFDEIKSHTTIGHNILKKCKFKDKSVCLTALEHHEKLDGSGYPANKTKICLQAQIIGIIDCYEALTNDDRPYRPAMGPFDTLNDIIGEDVKEGKFNKELYTLFVKSLGGFG